MTGWNRQGHGRCRATEVRIARPNRAEAHHTTVRCVEVLGHDRGESPTPHMSRGRAFREPDDTTATKDGQP